MYVVTVVFVAKPEFREAFREAMIRNAQASREREPGCRQFDVCIDPADSATIFLYEVYDDRAAFDAHTRTDHFREFDTTVKDWVAHKAVTIYERVDP